MKNLYFTLFALLLTFTACNDEVTNPNDPPLPSTGDKTDFQKMVIDYGLTTFQKVMADEEDNVLVSPLSLESALYMAMNGTAGKTLEEFRTALKADEFYPDGLNAFYKELVKDLDPKNNSTKLGLANTVFYDESKVTFHDEFEEIIKDVFDGDFNQADFRDAASVDIINDWAKDNTEERIKKILNEIKSDEALFLINALYFTATWERGFEPTYTSKEEFTTEDGTTISVDMMASDDVRRFYQGNDYSAVDLKFSDDEYSMTFILPENDQRTLDFVNGFSEEAFYDFYTDLYENKLIENRIMIRVPKFEIEANKNMNDILMEMGLETAFNDADLSKMGTFNGGRTYFSRVLHDTFLKIDEKGAEGAAVTTVGVGVESVPPSIDFNRPFLFIIRHVKTNTPIFIGKLGDPS
ncbi:MAG: serpin family protein [Bacteroidota bacterium]